MGAILLAGKTDGRLTTGVNGNNSEGMHFGRARARARATARACARVQRKSMRAQGPHPGAQMLSSRGCRRRARPSHPPSSPRMGSEDFRLTVTVSLQPLVEVAKNARLNRSRHGIAPLPYRGRPWSVSWQLSLWSPRATLQGRWSLVQLRPRQVHRVAGVCLQQGPPALCLSRHAPDQLRPPPDGNALRGQRDVVRLQLAQAVQFAATVCLQSVAPWLHVSPLRAAEQWARGEGQWARGEGRLRL